MVSYHFLVKKGWLWRNELGWDIANKGHELYLGIDRGKGAF